MSSDSGDTDIDSMIILGCFQTIDRPIFQQVHASIYKIANTSFHYNSIFRVEWTLLLKQSLQLTSITYFSNLTKQNTLAIRFQVSRVIFSSTVACSKKICYFNFKKCNVNHDSVLTVTVSLKRFMGAKIDYSLYWCCSCLPLCRYIWLE